MKEIVAAIIKLGRRIKHTLVSDVIEFLINRTTWLDGDDAPPSMIEFVGGGFVPVGNHLVEIMVRRAGLADGMTVLDIGCGIGRAAVALRKRFRNLAYCGFDVVAFEIAWCRKKFTGAPTYRFVRANIFNSLYNPRGTEQAATYAFPMGNGTAGFVFATSVFTHMRGEEVAHYLRESARCMAGGATGYFTCFVLDDESRAQIASGAAAFKFRYPREDSFVELAEEPEAAVAFDRPLFESMVRRAGLEFVAFFPGAWRGGAHDDYQDAYVLRKPGRS